jgi:DNA-binding NtrC family response regulator
MSDREPDKTLSASVSVQVYATDQVTRLLRQMIVIKPLTFYYRGANRYSMGELSTPVSILCVDDESHSADLTAIRLEQLDERFSVETAARAKEGLAYIEDNHVDCIVSDYKMPDIDGLAFFEMVHNEYPQLPFVLFTGRGSEAVADDARSRGVTKYLEKTTTDRYEVLAEQVRNAVKKRRAEQGL